MRFGKGKPYELVMQDFPQKSASNQQGKITQTPFDLKPKI